MGARGDEKTAWRTVSGEINVGRGAEGVLARENVELRKLVAILVLYDAMCCVDVETCLVLKRSYPMSN